MTLGLFKSQPLKVTLIVFVLLKASLLWGAKGFATPEVKRFKQDLVKNHGFEARVVDAWFAGIVFKPKIIRLMNTPYEKKNWHQYRKLF